MATIEDLVGQKLCPGDFVTIQGWRGLEMAKVRRFSSSCMICDYTYITHNGNQAPGKLQPYLPDHHMTASNKKYPNRMLKVLKITQEQYDTYHENL